MSWIKEIETEIIETDDIIDLLHRQSDHAKVELDLGGNAVEVTLCEYDESFNSHDVPFARFVLVGVPLNKFKNQGSYDFWVDEIDEEFEDPTTYRTDNIDSIELSFTQESGWNPIILYFPRDCVKRYLRNVRKITEKWCD